MSTELLTPGTRLRDLIERRGGKMKTFAEASGVTPNTLSKFVNDRQPMSNKYIRRAAELLDVTPEYIKCESDDMTPPRYLRYNDDVSTEMKDYTQQTWQFSHMEQYLQSQKVEFIRKMKIKDVIYIQSTHGEWFPIDGKTNSIIDEYGLGEISSIKEIYKNPGECEVWVEMTYKNRKIKLSEADYKRWLRYITATIELMLQEKFEVYHDISMDVADSDYDRALKGAERLKNNENDTEDIYEQHPKPESKERKKNVELTDQEKLLQDIFGRKDNNS